MPGVSPATSARIMVGVSTHGRRNHWDTTRLKLTSSSVTTELALIVPMVAVYSRLFALPLG